jgi:hypothetical protein
MKKRICIYIEEETQKKLYELLLDMIKSDGKIRSTSLCIGRAIEESYSKHIQKK